MQSIFNRIYNAVVKKFQLLTGKNLPCTQDLIIISNFRVETMKKETMEETMVNLID